jgi:flagellar biosynthetic protein FliO
VIDHRIGTFLVICLSAAIAGADNGPVPEDLRARLPMPDLLDIYVQQAADDEPARASHEDRELQHPDRQHGAALARGDEQPSLPRADLTVARRSVERSGQLRDLVPLLSVLALILVAVLAMKRFLPGRRLLAGGGVVEVVARTPLSGKQSLVLVKLGERILLLGVTADRISTLSVVDDPDQVATLAGELASHQPSSISREFARSFAEASDSYGGLDRGPADAAGGHVRGLLDKVRRLGRRVA